MALTKVTGGTISTTSNYEVGVITATKFVGPFEGDVSGITTGASKVITSDESSDTTCFPLFVNSSTDAYQAPKLGSNLTFNSSTGDLGATKVTAEQFVGNISGTGATFTTLNVSGTLNYTHVTDVYSVGVATFANNVQIGAGISVVGVSTFTNGVGIADSIFHTGDTNTAIRFPSNDTVTFETAGDERFRIKSNGFVGIGTDNPTRFLHLRDDTNTLISLESTDSNADLVQSDTGGSTRIRSVSGALEFFLGGDASSTNATSSGKKLTITSGGQLCLGTTSGPGEIGLYLGDGSNPAAHIYANGTHHLYLLANAYYAGGWKYLGNGEANSLALQNGDFLFNNASENSGGAAQAVSWSEKFRIRNDGNVVAANDLAVTGVTTSNAYDLSAISTTITQTAVDIFVYDTRNDSDGGAWRNRTQHTSWYNETLGTSTRGARKEFPCVAVIVITSSNVLIYDGDDPEMPLWMKFDQYGAVSLASNMITAYSNSLNCTYMLNGKLVVGTTYSSQNEGLFEIDFITDRGRVYRTQGSGVTGGYYTKSIVDRNSQTGKHAGDFDEVAIPGQKIMDVSMIVVPNAQIDKATGLPRPTIAVATKAGIGIIKDDGTAHALTDDHGGTVSMGSVDFDRETYALLYTSDYNASEGYYKCSCLPMRVWSGPYAGSNTYYSYQFWDRTLQTGGNYTVPAPSGNSVYDFISMGKAGSYAIRTDDSPNHADASHYPYSVNIFQEDQSNAGNSNTATFLNSGMIAYLTTTGPSGWMNGDIRLAALASTDSTNIGPLVSQLVTNSEFGSDTSGWTAASGATISVSGGQFTVVSPAASWAGAYQAITTVVGKRYILRFELVSSNNWGGVGISNVGGVSAHRVVDSNWSGGPSAGWRSVEWTATQTTYYVTIHNLNTTNTTTTVLDNITVVEADVNRCKKRKSLRPYGTIIRTAVKPGAELMGYSFNNSHSNYLRGEYTDTLDFGTGDFACMAWVNKANYSSTGFIFDRCDDGNNNRVCWYFENDDLKLYTKDGSTTSEIGNGTVEIPSSWDGEWIFIVSTRSSTGQMQTWVNGELFHEQVSTVANITNTSAHTIVGGRFNNQDNNEFQGSIALLRMTATIPSPKQIEKIYYDELKLFQTNAKCSLYGTSEQATAIAHDNETGILHVGTTSGRSDFRGLTRINNTTTAVATVISASSGLITDE